MLWTPGRVVFYGNGKEFLRWESPCVCSMPMTLILQNTIGGWETDPLDDSKPPSDFCLDYIRLWPRADLASPEDCPQPNAGRLDSFSPMGM